MRACIAASAQVRLLFDRQESGDCSSLVMVLDFKINQSLPANTVTAVEFTPTSSGEYGFVCGMNMLQGEVRVVGEPGPVGTAVAVAERPGHDHGGVAG